MYLLLLAALATAQSTPDWHVLHATGASASSHLRSNWNRYDENYHPNYVLDDNPATAWVEGVDGDGIGQRLTIPVSGLSSARAVRLEIRNGYQKSTKLLAANSAAKEIHVTVRGLRGEVSGEATATLTASMGWQEVIVPVAGSVQAIEIEVRSVHPGKLYRDTCISDVRVAVDSDVPYAADVEARKHEQLLAWIAGRVAQAKELAAVDATYPFAATSWQVDFQPAPPDVAARMAPYHDRLAAAPTDGPWLRLTPSRRFPEPDGLWLAWDAYIRLSDLGLFEAPDEGWRVVDRVRPQIEEDAESVTVSATNARRIGDGERTEALVWQARTVVEARGSHTDTTRVMVSYDANGLAESVYVEGKTDGDFERGDIAKLYLLTWNDRGQLAKVEVLQHDVTLDPSSGLDDRRTYTSRAVCVPL